MSLEMGYSKFLVNAGGKFEERLEPFIKGTSFSFLPARKTYL